MMRHFIIKWLLIAFAIFPLCNVLAYSPSDVNAYVAKFKAAALQNERQYGIPATIILAQGILESGAGTSGLTRSSNNHFGIKSGRSWGGKVHRAWDDEAVKSRFRVYSSAAESYSDHARLLSSAKRYRSLFSYSVYDYRRWAFGLKAAGYATAPDYAQALIGIIDRYRLYEVNGGVKLKPGKSVKIIKIIQAEKPVFDSECVLAEEEESEEEVLINEAISKYVVEINGIHCIALQPGEDLRGIARKHDISVKELLEYNESAKPDLFRTGDVVFLARKKKRYEGPQDDYVAKGGETLHDVAQQFGVQLHQLAKINNLNDYISLEKGRRIALK